MSCWRRFATLRTQGSSRALRRLNATRTELLVRRARIHLAWELLAPFPAEQLKRLDAELVARRRAGGAVEAT